MDILKLLNMPVKKKCVDSRKSFMHKPYYKPTQVSKRKTRRCRVNFLEGTRQNNSVTLDKERFFI